MENESKSQAESINNDTEKLLLSDVSVSANGRCNMCSDKCIQFSIKFNACYSRLLAER